MINKTFLNETLTMKADEHMNGYLYHCHVEYIGLLQIECPSYPLVVVYSKFVLIFVFLLFKLQFIYIYVDLFIFNFVYM